MCMASINQLFDKFAVAYQHSLYAIEQEEVKANKKRLNGRANVKKRYERERSKAATISSNNLMVTLHKIGEVCSQISCNEENVIRVAEYLDYGKISVENLKENYFPTHQYHALFPLLDMEVLFWRVAEKSAMQLVCSLLFKRCYRRHLASYQLLQLTLS